MNQLSIEEGDLLIATFMGYKIGRGNYHNGMTDDNGDNTYPCLVAPDGNKITHVYYHTSWDWLMPCWIKFVAIYHELGRQGKYPPERKLRSEFHDASDKGDITVCHEILVTGIQWYNTTKSNQS